MFQFGIATPPVVFDKLSSTLTALGLTTNLKLCLDASDINSVASGSQTKWLDVSGNGEDFFRGVDGSASSDDPTFNGTPGGQSRREFYSFDSFDVFTYDTTNPAWVETLHKDSAVFSAAFWVYVVDAGGTEPAFFGTMGAAGTGVATYYSGGTTPVFAAYNAGASALTKAASTVMTASAWNFMSLAFNEATGSLIFNINGTAESYSSQTYTSPSSSSASQTLQIGARGNSALASLFKTGNRIASVAIWQGTALSAANLAAIFSNTRAKFSV
jgi:hypothetical protein